MMDKFSLPESPSRFAFPVASAGYPLIFAAAFATGVLALLQLRVPALLGLAVTFFIAFFFRDPDRVVPVSDGAVISPADGRVVIAGKVDQTLFYDGPCQKVSIFMSVFNVHVNRIPHEGLVEKIAYHPGKFVNASLDKASEDNERNAVFMITDRGKRLLRGSDCRADRQANHLSYSGWRNRSPGTAFRHDLLWVAAGCLSSARCHAQCGRWRQGQGRNIDRGVFRLNIPCGFCEMLHPRPRFRCFGAS